MCWWVWETEEVLAGARMCRGCSGKVCMEREGG